MSSEDLQAILSRYDINKNGLLDEEETKKILEEIKEKTGEYELLKRYDKNQNGIIDEEEMKQFQSDISSLAKTERHSTPSTFAVGGHAGIGKVIRKPVNTCEGEFYTHMTKNLGSGQRFFPEFFGILQAAPDVPAYIFMEDLTSGYKKPAVMDIKIGKQTYLPTATLEKAIHMGRKDATTTSAYLGQRITGYNYYKSDGKSRKILKDVTFKIKSEEEFIFHLQQFFNDGHSLRTDVIKFILVILKDILGWKESLECNQSYYSSSILLVYDASNPESHGRAKIIDMANVIHNEGKIDENFNFGLRKLIELLEKIVKEGPEYVPPEIPHTNHKCPFCGHKF